MKFDQPFKSIIDTQSRDTFMDHVVDFLFSLLLDKFLINYLWHIGDWKLGSELLIPLAATEMENEQQ